MKRLFNRLRRGSMTESDSPETVAAVDLGSNSFHMIVARVDNGHVHVWSASGSA